MASRVSTNLLLSTGATGPLLLVGIFLAEGATRPGDDPVRRGAPAALRGLPSRARRSSEAAPAARLVPGSVELG
jgi:hypothetical protein